MPWATSKGEDYKSQLEGRDELSAISPGVFKESSNAERVYFIESFDALGNIVKNIFVQSIHQQALGIVVAAKGSRYIEKNGDQFLLMKNGMRYQGARDTREFSTTSFEQYAVRVETAEVKQKPIQIISKSSKELFENKDNANNAELQWRLAIPISALILAFLAIPLSALDPRSGRSINFLMAIVIYIIYNNMLSIMQAWVAQGKFNASLGLWPVHFIFAMMAVYLFYRRAQQLPVAPKILTTNWFKIGTKTL
jgi:lipopolysaccharide export system permease protein